MIGESFGARTSASEAGTIAANSARPNLVNIEYILTQLLGFVAQRYKVNWEAFGTKEQVVQISDENDNVLVAGMAVIGSETTGVLRQACLHEEIVQALGLANDHPDVRPSIFNDDGEFALLTEHDEHLLRILYDSRLEPGMTAETAMPIVRQIAAEIPLDQPRG